MGWMLGCADSVLFVELAKWIQLDLECGVLVRLLFETLILTFQTSKAYSNFSFLIFKVSRREWLKNIVLRRGKEQNEMLKVNIRQRDQ